MKGYCFKLTFYSRESNGDCKQQQTSQFHETFIIYNYATIVMLQMVTKCSGSFQFRLRDCTGDQ